jgi:hypothetical protein
MKRHSYNTILFFIIFLLLWQFDADAQCAMCKQAAETSLKSNPNSMARSLNSGILYLMAVPYLMIMFIFRKQIAQLWRTVFKKTSKVEGN